MNRSAGERWVEGYIEAWRTNDRDMIGALFSEDGRY